MKEDYKIAEEDKIFVPILRRIFAEIILVMKQLQTAFSQFSNYKPTIDITIAYFEERFEKFDDKIKQVENQNNQPSFCVQNPPIVENPVIKININLT